MSTRAVVGLLAVLICAALAAYILVPWGAPTPVGPRVTSVLATPPPVDSPAPTTMLAPAPKRIEVKETPTPTVETAPKPETSPLPIEALIADLRRDVEPGFWGHAQGATLDGRGCIVIARATPDVLDAVGTWLDARRARLDPERGQASGDPAAAEDLRGVMRGMLDRQVRLDGAARLVRVDRRAALELLAQVEKEEPDNDALEALRLVAADPRAGDVALPPRRGSLWEWLLRWPSASTRARVSELRRKAGHAAAVKTGHELTRLLRRGSLTVKLDGEPLWVAVRRLQIEALVEITLDPEVASMLEAKSVTLDEVARSLDVVLDALLAQLPADLRWAADPFSIEITLRADARADAAEPPLRTWYFDVRDLLGLPSAAREPAQPGAAPPMPPLYTEPSSK